MWRGTLRSHFWMLRPFCRALQDSPRSPLAVLTPRTFWSVILGHSSMIPGILAGRFKTVGIKNKQHHPLQKKANRSIRKEEYGQVRLQGMFLCLTPVTFSLPYCWTPAHSCLLSQCFLNRIVTSFDITHLIFQGYFLPFHHFLGFFPYLLQVL